MTEPEKFGLSHQTISKLKSVFSQRSEIEKVILYGSRAKGNYRPGSDIDLTLVAPKMNLSQLLKLESEIDELLLPYKVDLSLFHAIENEDLVKHIQRVGVKF